MTTLIPQLENDLVAAATRLHAPRRRLFRPTRRGLAAALAALLVAGGVAGATSIITREGKPIAPAPRGDFRGVEYPADGTGVIGATAPDPAGGPDWGIRLARSQHGAPCFAVGRVFHGKIGRYDTRTGVFRALPMRGPGSCSTRRLEPREVAWSMDSRPAFRGEPARSVIYGVVGSDVAKLEVHGPDGIRPLPLSKLRAFIAVFDGNITAYDVPTIATYEDGTTKQFAGRAHG
jgi:hypothetical protein